VRGFIAVIEDDPALRRVLGRGLEAAGFGILWSASGGGSALDLADAAVVRPDALVLDLGLPDADGLDVLGALHSRGMDAPTLVLTARTGLHDRLRSFGGGVDDYLAKPFAFAELTARLEVLVRRRQPRPPAPRHAVPEDPVGGARAIDAARSNPVRLDPVGHGLVAGGRAVALSPTEYRLLAALLARRGEVVRRATLISAAWPPGAIVRENTLDAYLTRIRRHLRATAVDARLDTVRGVGYRIGQHPED
jgi:DNA-binding response OmpR family regulator